MKLAIVGVGNAGSRVANRILATERATGRGLCGNNALLVNTAPPQFDGPEMVPEDRRLVIGDVHREVVGEGTGGDPDLGAEVARDDASEVLRAVDAVEFHEIDGFLVCAGLGGGTGGGAGSVVVDLLTGICDDPVYGLGVLPSGSEGERAALTAARSLKSFVDRADNVILFDNGAWLTEEEGDSAGIGAGDSEDRGREKVEGHRGGDTEDSGHGGSDDGSDPPPESRYAWANDALATRIVSLFAAGEIRGGTVAENLMDPSDLMRTLDTGGVSSIGYAATEVEPQHVGLLRRLKGLPLVSTFFSTGESEFSEVIDTEADEEEPRTTSAARIETLVRQAVHSTLTVDCEVSSADRALVLLSGPPHELSRKGFETSRYWLEGEADTVEVMAGDEPRYDTPELSATVLLSTVTEVPPVEAMQEQALLATGDFEFPGDSEVVEGVEL